MMYVFGMLVTGLVVGALATWLESGRSRATARATMLVAIAGSVVAGVLDHIVAWQRVPSGASGIVVSAFGAMLALLMLRLGTRRRTRTTD